MNEHNEEGPLVFVSYAHEDADLYRKLHRHLSLLQRQKRMRVWASRDMSAGTEREHEIQTHLMLADIILLLVSSDFLSSKDTSVGLFRTSRAKLYHKEERLLLNALIRSLLRSVFSKIASLAREVRKSPLSVYTTLRKTWSWFCCKKCGDLIE